MSENTRYQITQPLAYFTAVAQQNFLIDYAYAFFIKILQLSGHALGQSRHQLKTQPQGRMFNLVAGAGLEPATFWL